MISLEYDKLHPQMVDTFRENGVLCLRGMLSPEWLDRLRDGIEEAIEKRSEMARSSMENEGFRTDGQLWRKYPVFNQFMRDAGIGEMAATIMDSPEARLYSDTMFVKEPSTPTPSPWHNDLPYFLFSGTQNCSFWVALDKVTTASGAMAFVPGSHRWGKLFQPVVFSEKAGVHEGAAKFDGAVPDIDGHPELYPQVSFDLEPGDMTVHHLLTVHKAGPNTTKDVRRRAYSMRFAGADAVWTERQFSPNQFDTTLKEGEKLEGAAFPQFWP